MLYLINGKYYVNTSPLRYTEVLLSKKNGEGVITITKNKIEIGERTTVIPVTLAEEIKKISEPKKPEVKKEPITETIKPSYQKKNRFDKK